MLGPESRSSGDWRYGAVSRLRKAHRRLMHASMRSESELACSGGRGTCRVGEFWGIAASESTYELNFFLSDAVSVNGFH